MNPNRQKRKEEIQKALSFIQSSLPYPDPNTYEDFLVQLVCNLLDEGNAAFREGDWTLARGHFGEGVSVARYAEGEGVKVPAALLESLYVNRAAAQHNMREIEASVMDCDSALSVCKDSGRALYRKAVCLKELGRLNEAYECVTTCLGSPFPPLLPPPSPCLPPAFFPSAVTHLNTLDSFCETSHDLTVGLDSLDSFTHALPQGSLQPPLVVGGEGLDSLSEFTLPGGKSSHSFLPPVKISGSSNGVNAGYTNGHVASTLYQNPLEHTHDFTQACSACFIHTGAGVLDCEYRSGLSHCCKKDILLCRKKGEVSLPWRRVRPRPPRSNFQGPYVLCKEVLEWKNCKYGEACTFAYCQEEIDVWTQERRGLLTLLLVKFLDREKWVAVRPLPFAKTFPQQYDICVHILKQKKCHYIGNCSFAHSLEEKELWTFMKNTGLRDLQQVYDTWLRTANQNKRLDGASTSTYGEEKQITMPTDFADAACLIMPGKMADSLFVANSNSRPSKPLVLKKIMDILPSDILGNGDREVEKLKLSSVTDVELSGDGGGDGGGGGFGGMGGVSASLTPTIWDKTIPYDGENFHLEYVDLDEFLLENEIPETLEEELHRSLEQELQGSDAVPEIPTDVSQVTVEMEKDAGVKKIKGEDERHDLTEMQMDEKYWKRRKKNNLAAKRSREARRLKENQIVVRAGFLEHENAVLRQEVAELRKTCSRCKKVVSLYEAKYGTL
ncbi:Hepatic leukemia factor [Bagarius yarrelli]|uniref:Hepatic leukemia factor n=1 Tax=Bagarius yarrelli TaxID=175774 RepID=A0A556V7K3_BAGYA|nr:Hepatic leukemia factor [Bagarius yarrelli]